MVKKSRNSLMQRGSGIFKCTVCGRKTRETGDGSPGKGPCSQCYELAGIENMIADADDVRACIRRYTDDVMALVAEIRARDGNVDPWDDLIRKCHKPATVAELVQEALDYQADAFERDEPVSGADLVQWFSDWRERLAAAQGK